MVVVGEFEQGDVGGALEQRLQHGQHADDGHAGEQAGGDRGGHLAGERGERHLVGKADGQGEQREREPAGGGGADHAAALGHHAAAEDGDQ